MHPGKGRVADGDLDPKYHDRSQRSSLYTIGEAQNASLGDNYGTIVQGPHFGPETSTFGTKNSNVRDQLYIQGGKVKIYLGPDSLSPEITLQRRGIIEVLSQLLSSILGWVPPPSNHTEGPLPSMEYDAAFLSTGQRESYTESQGVSDASVESPSTLSGSVLQEQVEPDSDIKTHSLGNCPGFSLLPLDDLDSQSLGLLDRPVPAEIYVGSMLSSGMGLACWNTKPHAGAVGPALGDVGTYSAQDGFIKIFNLWDDEESIRKTARTMGIGSYDRPIPMRTKRTIQGRSKRGDIVKSLGMRGNVVYKSDFSDIKDFEIRCTSERGAALLLTSAADQEDLDGRQRLRKHILDYPELFYRHADAIQGIGQEESLYIITGSVKSDSCALAAFGEPAAPDEPAVVLANSTRPGQHLSSWVWTNQGTANTQLSECSNLDGEKDQTLFLRGFKLDFSSSFRSKLGGPASGGGWDEGKFGDGDDGRIGSEDEGTGEGDPGAGTGSNAGDGGSSFGRVFGTLDSSGSRYRGRSVQLQSFPNSESRRSSCHPCDIINECLLLATGSRFALSHDDDWLPFLKDQSIWESTARSPLSVSDRSSGVCIIQGVACFKAEPEVSEYSKDKASALLSPKSATGREIITVDNESDKAPLGIEVPAYIPCERYFDNDKKVQVSIDAGMAQGITVGELFAIHENNYLEDGSNINPQIGVLSATSVATGTAFLQHPPGHPRFKIPKNFYAKRIDWGNDPPKVYSNDKAWLERVLLARKSATGRRVITVDNEDEASLVIEVERDWSSVHLYRNDPLLNEYLPRKFPFKFRGDVPGDIQTIIGAWQHFNYHLHRRGKNEFPQVRMELHYLEPIDPEDDGMDSFEPENYKVQGGNLLVSEPSEVRVPDSDADRPLGMTLYNDGDVPIYPYLFYFDPNDLTIIPWFTAPFGAGSGNVDPPLEAHSQFPIGYGNGAATPWQFCFEDDRDKDVGFFKLFLSVSPVNFHSLIQEESPFKRIGSTRGSSPDPADQQRSEALEKLDKDSWGVKMATVIQLRD
ncbi:hypothetical protein D9611_009329 [Ephemerocybe angulata]|uniref:Uncharacterized protein n=1 Tax=Ephemerocybe angulata TaxID=980116 RepID=A0A8H5BGL9_9AGAR|nr:hypothetical protein D9611_009329 [Tulosesus angulatus]